MSKKSSEPGYFVQFKKESAVNTFVCCCAHGAGSPYRFTARTAKKVIVRASPVLAMIRRCAAGSKRKMRPKQQRSQHANPRQERVRHQYPPASDGDDPRLMQQIPHPGAGAELRRTNPIK
jgi:hypothetical protein